MTQNTNNSTEIVSVMDVFGFSCNWNISRLSPDLLQDYGDDIPQVDPSYVFDPAVTRSLLAGFQFNKRVMVQGYHGTGKTSHILQVASQLNYPCIRVNLDGGVTRPDLIGRDAIVLKDEKQVTEFVEGVLPHYMQRPYALILDEYDAGRPDIMFAFQRLLEEDGKLTLLQQNKVISPHPYFRIFATANTIGHGDLDGQYAGTHRLNQAQMDRWNMLATLGYMKPEVEQRVIMGKYRAFMETSGLSEAFVDERMIGNMVTMANRVRDLFMGSTISTVMSPRTCIMWAENTEMLGDVTEAFKQVFGNKMLPDERKHLTQFYQQTMGKTLVL